MGIIKTVWQLLVGMCRLQQRWCILVVNGHPHYLSLDRETGLLARTLNQCKFNR